MPSLPVEEIRGALEADDLDTAAALINAHGRQVRAALETAGVEPSDELAWQRLLGQQRVLLEQLQAEREQARASLQRLRENRRSTRAYVASGG